MPHLTTARFHTTVAALHQLPVDDLPEVAFVGRSNAGKSSAINVLCNRRRLAFASRTPGRTQALNYFAVGAADRIDGFIVDTPGYGYAAAPLETKREWDALAGRYLGHRPQLSGVVLVADIRRQLTPLDAHLLSWITPETPVVVALTKSDKLPHAQRQAALRAVRAELDRLRPDIRNRVVLFSALSRSGSDALSGIVEAWLLRDAVPGLALDEPAGEKKEPRQPYSPGAERP